MPQHAPFYRANNSGLIPFHRLVLASHPPHSQGRAYACILLLDPYRRQGNDVKSRLEYLGLSDTAGSPCASSGIAGNATSQGPLVPALVQ